MKPPARQARAMTLREESALALLLWVLFHVALLGPVEAVGYGLGLAVLLSTGLVLAKAWRLGWIAYYRAARRFRR